MTGILKACEFNTVPICIQLSLCFQHISPPLHLKKVMALQDVKLLCNVQYFYFVKHNELTTPTTTVCATKTVKCFLST
jgi:hypothetical protein